MIFFPGHQLAEFPLKWVPWWAENSQQTHSYCGPSVDHEEPAGKYTLYPLCSPYTVLQLQQDTNLSPASCQESNMIRSPSFALQHCSKSQFCLSLLRAPPPIATYQLIQVGLEDCSGTPSSMQLYLQFDKNIHDQCDLVISWTEKYQWWNINPRWSPNVEMTHKCVWEHSGET